MLNKKVRKALTLVEVLVVVAILAILATVGIVGYSAFVTRSNKSNDATLVTELNHFVKAQNQVKELYTVTDAQVALKKNGFNLENLKPSQKGYRYAYNVEKKDFLIIDKNWKPVDYTEYEHQEDIFAFVSSEKEMNEAMNYSIKGKGDGYSVYLQEDFTYESSNVNHTLEINEGADLGLIVNCTKVYYKNISDAQTVTVYTPTFGTILNIEGEHDTVKHWGYAGLLNIYKIDCNSFDAYGVYGRVNLYQGHFKAMPGSTVYCIVTNGENCFVSIQDGATVYVDGKPYTGSLDKDSKLFVGDIANHVCDHSVTYTIFDNNNEYLICALCGYTVVKVIWYDKDGVKHEKYVAVNDGDDPVITPYAVYEVDEDDVPTGDGPIDIKDIENKELTDPAKYIPGNVPTCSHSWGALIETKENSCTEYGEAYKKCALCGAELHYQTEPHGHKLSKVGGKLATCTAAGYESYYACEYCLCLFADNTAKILTTKDQKAIQALGHKFTSPEYTWSGNQCTAERHCTRDGCDCVEKETQLGTFVLDTPATCLKAETGHYQVASTVWQNNAFGTSDSTKDSVVGTNGALGHDWGIPSYNWTGNQCTAKVTCERQGCEETITEVKTGEFVQDTENNCTDPNKGHYVVKSWDHSDRFAANVSTAANSVTGDLKAKGHTFGTASYSWNGANCTATAKCTVCQHVETETKAGQFIEDTKATCNDSNKGHYQVSNWDNTKLFETQNSPANSVTGAVGALGHVFGTPTYKWDGKSCTATVKCIHEGCNVTETETKEGVYQESVGATCTEGGKGYYVVSTWDNTKFSEQKLAVDGTEVKALGHLDVFDDWGNHHCTREGCKELGVKRAHSTEKGKCSCGMINIESLTEMTESGTAAKPVRYKLIKDSELSESITIRCNHAIVYFDNHTVTLSSCGDAKMGIKVTGNDITFLGNGSTKSINSQLSVAAMITEGDNITFQDFYLYSSHTYCLRVKGNNTVIKGNSNFINDRDWVLLSSEVTPTISVEKTLNGTRSDLTILDGTFFNWSMIIKGDGGCCYVKGGVFNTNRKTLSSIVNFDNRADFAITGGLINVTTDLYAEFKNYIDLDVYEPIYQGNAMYLISEMEILCYIGQTEYRTFSKAYNEAKPGETIRLVKDITWDGSLDKEISFSGNHTLTCTGQIKAGTFDCKVIANGGIVGGKFNTGVYTVSGLNLDNAKFNTRISGNYIEVFNRVYAKIGTTEYTSFAEAYAAAKDGDTIEILENCYYDGGISKNVTITGSKTLTVQGTISNGYFACGLVANSRIEGGYFAKSIFGDGKGLENGLFRSFSSGNWWHVVRAVASITENNNTTYYEDFASALKDGQGVIITIYGQVSYNGSISDYIGVVGESYDGHDATLTVSGDISNGIYNVRVKAANITGGVYGKKVSVTGQTTGGTFSDDYSHSLNIPSSYFEKDSKIGDSDAFEVCFIAATVEYTTYDGERWVTKTKNYASFAEAYAAADDDEVITLYKNDTYTGNLAKDVEINGNYSLTVKNGVISKGEFNVTVLTDNSKVAGGSFLKSKYNSNMTIDGLYEPVESGNYYNVLLQIRDLYQVSYGTIESRKGTANFNSLEDLKAALDWEYRLGTGNCYNYDGRIVTGISVIKANTISTNISFDHEITITGSALITISSTISNIIFDCPTNLLSNPGTNVKFTSSHKPQLTNLKEYAPALVDGYYKIQDSVCYIGTTGYATFDEAYTIASSGTDKNIVLRTNCTYSGSAALTGITVSGNYTLGVSSAEITGGTYDNAKVTTAARKIKGGKFLNAVEKNSVVAKKVAILSGGYYQLADAKASIDDVYYYTFEEAYAAAQANQTLTIYVNTSYKGSLSKNITIKGDNNNIVLDIRSTDSISAGTYDCKLVFNASNVTGGKFNKDLISKSQLDHGTTVATLEGNYRVLTTAVAKVGDEYFGTFAEAYEKAKPTSAEITLLGNTSYDGSKGDLDKVTVSGSYTLTVNNCSIVGGTYNSTISIADRKISGGLFKQAIDKSKVVAEYVPVYNSDTYYHIEKADALMNGVYYLTFKEAYEVAGNNDITLIDNCSYDGNLTKNIKISGNYTITLGNTATITAGTYECKLSGYDKNNISKGVKFSKTNFETSNLNHGKTVAVDNGTYFEMIEAVAQVGTTYYATFGEAVTAAGKTNEIDLLDNISSYSGDVDGITVKSTAGKTLTLSGKVYNSTFKCKVFTSSNNVYEGNTFQIAGSTISLANQPLVIDEEIETGYKLTKKANYKVGNTYYLNMPSDAIAEGKTIVLYTDYTYSGDVSVNITVNSDNGSIFEVSGVISSGVYNCNVKASDVQGGSFKISDYNNSNVGLNGYYSKTEYNGMFSVVMLGVCRVVYTKSGNTKYATFNSWKEAYDACKHGAFNDNYYYDTYYVVSSIEILKPITITDTMNFSDAFTVTGSVKFYVNTTANNVTFDCPVKLLSNPGSSAKFKQKPELWTNTLAAVSNGSYYTITTAVCAVGDTGYATFNEAVTVANVNGAGKEIVLFTNCEYTESTSLNYCDVTSDKDASGNYLYGLNVTTAKIGGGTYKVKSVTTANGKINAGSFYCDIAKTQCVDWKVPVKNSTTGVTQVNTAKAKLGNEYYYTFDEAYKAASDGQTITINANTTVSYNLTKNITYKNNGSYTFKVNDSYGISAGTFDIKVSFNKDKVSGGKFATSVYKKSDLDHGTKAATIENSYYVLKDGTCKIGTEYFATFDDAYAVGSGKTITLVAAAKYSGSAALTNITVEGDSYTLTVSNASITGGTYKCTISIGDKKISGGSFYKEVTKAKCADKCVPVKNASNVWEIKTAKAFVNNVYYYTFAEAYAAASDGQTITLYASDSYTSGNLTKNVTISASSTSITLTITSTTKVEKGIYDVVLVNLEKSNISVGVKFKNSYYKATDLNYGSQVAFNDGTRFEIKSAPVIANDTPYATVDEAYKAGNKTIVIYENTTCNIELDGVTISGSFTLTLKATVTNSTFNCLTVAEKAGLNNTFNNKSSTVTPIADVCVKTNTSNLTTVSARFAVKYSSTGSYQYFYDLPSDALTNGVAIKIYQAHTISGNIARDITFESANSAVLTVSGAISKGTYNCAVVSTGTITGGTFNGKVTTAANSVSGGLFKKSMGSTINVHSSYCTDSDNANYIEVLFTAASNGTTKFSSFQRAYNNTSSGTITMYKNDSVSEFKKNLTVSGSYTLTVNGEINNGTFGCSLVEAKSTVSGGTFNCKVTTVSTSVSGGKFKKDKGSTINPVSGKYTYTHSDNYIYIVGAVHVGTTSYDSFDAAYNAISSGTITIHTNVSCSIESVNKNITVEGLDLTLTFTEDGVSVSNGTFRCKIYATYVNGWGNTKENEKFIRGGKFYYSIDSDYLGSYRYEAPKAKNLWQGKWEKYSVKQEGGYYVVYNAKTIV